MKSIINQPENDNINNIFKTKLSKDISESQILPSFSSTLNTELSDLSQDLTLCSIPSKSMIPIATKLGEKKITIIYGIHYSEDQFEVSTSIVYSKSKYLQGLLYNNISRIISINVPDSSVFRLYFVPYFLYNQLPLFPTMASENVIKCSLLAEFLGMDDMLLKSRESLATSLERHMKVPEFNPSNISKQELLNIFSIHAIQQQNRSTRDSITLRLRALLYWLNDSSEIEAMEMNKWFSAKCKCSWVLHVVTGCQKEFGDLRHELRESMDKFFVCPASIMASMTSRLYISKSRMN